MAHPASPQAPRGNTPPMDDRLAQYLLMVGNACNDAELAGLAVELTTGRGAVAVGIPRIDPSARPNDEADSTGWNDEVVVGGTTVSLEDTVQLRVKRPR